MKRLGQFLAAWVALQAILWPVFIVITFAANVNWWKLTHSKDGNSFRMYVHLVPGDKVYAQKFGGELYLMTGHAMVEVTSTRYSGSYWSNYEDGVQDDTDYNKVFMRLASSPADAARFTINGGFMWLRDRGGNYTYLVGVKQVRPEWEIVADKLPKETKAEYALAWQPVEGYLRAQEQWEVMLILSIPTISLLIVLGGAIVIWPFKQRLGGKYQTRQRGGLQPMT